MKNLRKLRESHGLSQQRFADLFGLSQQSIYKYENGISEPSIQTIAAIADYFHTSADYLIGYTENSSAYEKKIEVSLTPDEKYLIKQYRMLSTSYKSALHMLIDMHLQDLRL